MGKLNKVNPGYVSLSSHMLAGIESMIYVRSSSVSKGYVFLVSDGTVPVPIPVLVSFLFYFYF